MRRAILILFYVVPGLLQLRGQTYMVQGTIEDACEVRIYLASYYADRFSIVDSMESASGFFYFMFPGDEPPGIYRIIYSEQVDGVLSENRFVEFIYNRENIEITVTNGVDGPVPGFDHTVENLVYHEFMQFELAYESDVMETYREMYDPGSPKENKNAASKYDSLQVRRSRFMDSLTVRFPGLYAVRIMNAFRSPFTPGNLTHRQRIDALKASFFNDARIDDPILLFAPVYSYKIVDYLSLYKVDTFTLEQQELAYMEAVDRIMEHVSPDPELRSFVLNFLLGGFQMLGMEKVQRHLTDNYLVQSCESDVAELVRQRMEAYQRMVPGTLVPDFVVRDKEGKSHQLSRMEHPYMLILFWASSCEHCRDLLPQLNQWYLRENNLDIEVVTISVDSSARDFERYVEELNPAWITARDPLGWNGKAASDYHIYATPAMFLVDSDRIIVARPENFRNFLRIVRKLEGE